MYWLCIDYEPKYDNAAPWDTPPTQLTLQKIGVRVAFEAYANYFSFQLVNLGAIHLTKIHQVN